VLFQQFLDDDLGCASYLVGDEDAGVAAIVDSPYAIEPVLEAAARRDVEIVRAIETHTHAPDGLRPLSTLETGGQDLEPCALDLDPLRGRPRAQFRQLDPELGGLALLDEARLHVDVRPCTFCRHEREKRR